MLQAVFETGESLHGDVDDLAKVLRIALDAGEQGCCLASDDLAGLLQSHALAFQTTDQTADTVFIGTKGPLDGRHFLMDDVFECSCPLVGMFNATHQQVHFLAHGLGDGREILRGNVLGPNQPQG